MLKPANLRRADLFSGGLISIIGVFVLNAARKMPMGGTYGGVDNPWYASPGTVPLLLGVLFMASGIWVFVNAWRQGGGRQLGATLRGIAASRRVWIRVGKVGGLWGGLLLYLLCLARKPFGAASLWFQKMVSAQGHLGFLTEANGANYCLVTAAFLVVAVWLYGPRLGLVQLRWRSLLLLIFLSVTPLMMAYVFAIHLRVPLP